MRARCSGSARAARRRFSTSAPRKEPRASPHRAAHVRGSNAWPTRFWAPSSAGNPARRTRTARPTAATRRRTSATTRSTATVSTRVLAARAMARTAAPEPRASRSKWMRRVRRTAATRTAPPNRPPALPDAVRSRLQERPSGRAGLANSGRTPIAIVRAPSLLDLAPYGRHEDREDSLPGWPQRPTYG